MTAFSLVAAHKLRPGPIGLLPSIARIEAPTRSPDKGTLTEASQLRVPEWNPRAYLVKPGQPDLTLGAVR